MALLERGTVVQAMGRLVDRTESGQQKWTVFEGGSDEYQSETQKFNYFVSSRDGDGTAPYVFEIWRKVEGSEYIKVGDYRTITSSSGSATSEANRTLSKLYASAKASTFGISGLANDLLDDLS